MWDRFTDRARKVMQLANQEAQRLNHEYLGTEHVLLGLVKEGGGTAAKVLSDLGIDIRKVRLETEKLVQSGPDMVTIGKMPLTPRCKKCLDLAIEAARDQGVNFVGTEHILLGLSRENEGVAAQVLNQLGATSDKIFAGIRAAAIGETKPASNEAFIETIGGVRGVISVSHAVNQGFINPEQARVIFQQFYGMDEKTARQLAGDPEPERQTGETVGFSWLNQKTQERILKDKENRRMREASGSVQSNSRLVRFLYLLARDGILIGEIERIIESVSAVPGSVVFTNGWLAQWAKDAAARLEQQVTQ